MTRFAIITRPAIIALAAAALPAAALAHPGHLGAAGGHAHWELLGGIAVLALAVGAAAWAGRRT